MRLQSFLFLIFALVVAAMPVRAAQSEDAILVLDGSGSMWGQIDEEAKITIAKRVLLGLLDELPAERRLGLMAYGHNRKGDCTDIEELATVGAQRSAIKSAVEGINPKGKTPMTAAVKIAAEKLKYTENKATVILISDGIETCEPDPCGVASALEQAGIDFTAHVIGFDVSEENEQAQLRCIAENTGGQFISASNADDLTEALQTTVVETPVEPTSNLYLRATELQGGLVIEEGLSWTVTPSAGGGDAVVSETDAGSIEATVPPGAYDVEVVRPSDGLKGSATMVAIPANGSKTVTIALEFPVEATVTVEPQGESIAGTDIAVAFTGPERQGDYIALSKKGADAGQYNSYKYVKSGNPVKLRLPVEPGDYEVRYMLGRPIRVLASVDHKALPATATLSAQDTAVAGDTIEVEFTGPPAGSGDYITITKPEDADNKYNSYHYTKGGSPGEIRMPLEPGVYELRFVQGNNKVLARRPITVTEALATVSAQESAVIGETIKVEFTGPGKSGDYITVTAPDAAENSYTSYSYTKKGSPAEIRMPLTPGEYEIRFVQSSKKVIARQSITVNDVESSLEAKSSAVAGETVSVEFVGPPPGSGDFITVTRPDAADGKYGDYHYTKNGSPGDVRMPLDAGDYELRYVIGNSQVIARKPITVTAATATLDAVSEAQAKSTIKVSFTGPPVGSGDYIAISEVGSKDTAYLKYTYVKNGNPADLRLPAEAGDYELRYIQGNKKVLARRPIKVTPAP
ncbi:MAG: hypothetical protein DHS20C05_24050 [Hyphococcus sp.]|nr:MAG: hypothetical protein DHS20C05_24050 [Marinicaulis sp.]